MKKLFLSIALTGLSLAAITAQAQNNTTQAAVEEAAIALESAEDVPEQVAMPKYWTAALVTNINFGQTYLSQWAAGGYNNYSLSGNIDGRLDFNRDKITGVTHLVMDYGFLYSADKPILQKNKDRILFDSKWGYKTKADSKWSVTAAFNFNSQFTDTYKYSNPGGENPTREDWLAKSILQSSFLSPAYTTLSLGIDWAPKPWFTINFSPLTGGFTIVRREELRKKYSMELKDEYASHTGAIENYMYRAARFQLGAQLTANAKFNINDVFTGETKLVLFSDYLNRPQDPRVNWDNKITWQLAKHFAVAVQTWLIYDPNVLIDGTKKVQFKEFLNLNFTYTLAPKKKK